MIKRLCVFGLNVLFFSNMLLAQKSLDSICTYYYSAENDSVMWVKKLNEYNSFGQKSSNAIYWFDGQTNRWIGWSYILEECIYCQGHYEYSYDDDGNLILSVGYIWDGYQQVWTKVTKQSYEYDSAGNRVSAGFKRWKGETSTWNHVYAWEYGFDDSGRQNSVIFYKWNPENSTWIPRSKTSYPRDTTQLKTIELRQSWNATARDWDNYRKTEWYYDSTGLNTGHANFSWDWIFTRYGWTEYERHKIEYEYDSVGHPILIHWYSTVNGYDWHEYRREERSYNKMGLPVLSKYVIGQHPGFSYTEKTWNYSSIGKLVQETETGYMVRWAGIPEDYQVQRTFDDDGDIIQENWNYYNRETQSYELEGRDYFFYSSKADGITDFVTEELLIYPNPTEGILNVSGLSQAKEINIYTLQGRLVRSINQFDSSIDISNLSAGTYILTIDRTKQALFRTLVIKR